MRKLRLSVCKKLHKCLDSDGDWDGVYDESYEYIIYNEEGLEVVGMDGYHTEDAARKAGEEKLKRMEENKSLKFNFKSQICTTREQSERLLALGLKKETADMIIPPYNEHSPWAIGKNNCLNKNWLPAWSLHRLIEMMPKSIYHNKVDWYKVIYNSSVCYERCEYSCYRSCEIDLYVDIINCIEWLIKEGYFNKDYLEDN